MQKTISGEIGILPKVFLPDSPSSPFFQDKPCRPGSDEWQSHKNQCVEKICHRLIQENNNEEILENIQFIINSIEFVSFETFNDALLSGFDRVLSAIQGKAYGILFQNGRNKSGVWVYQLLRAQRNINPVAVRACDNILDRDVFLSKEEDYADDVLVDAFDGNLAQISSEQSVQDWIFLDDASYSGQQMRDQIVFSAVQLIKCLPEGSLNIHVCIPYMTEHAAKAPLRVKQLKEKASEWEIPEEELKRVKVKTYPTVTMKTFSEKVTDNCEMSLISKLFEHLIVKKIESPQFCNVTLTFFEHKLPDDRSCLRTYVIKNRDQQLTYIPIEYPKVSPPYKTEEFSLYIKALEKEGTLLF